jgi:MFS family permease
MNLICEDRGPNKKLISLFGSFLMFGLTIGSFFFTNLCDIFGRKKVLLISLIVSNLTLLPIILGQRHYALTLVFTFLFGVTASVRYSVSYLLSTELTTTANSEFFGILCLVGDSLGALVIGIYFWVFKDMATGLWFLFVVQIFCVVILKIYVPESPRFLYNCGKKEGFIKSLADIAKFNGSESFNIISLSQDYDLMKSSSHHDSAFIESRFQILFSPVNRPNLVVLCLSWSASSYTTFFVEFYMKFVPFQNIYGL